MARASALDPCLLCGNAPCTCISKQIVPRKRASPKRDIITAEPPMETVKSVESAMDRMRARARQAKSAQRFAAPTESIESTRHQLSEEDAATLAALRILAAAFQLEGPDIERWRPYLNEPASVHERASAWKVRRGT